MRGQLEQLAFVGHAVAVLEEAQLRAQNWATGKNKELNKAIRGPASKEDKIAQNQSMGGEELAR